MKIYRFEGSVESFQADREGLLRCLEKEMAKLRNYEDLAIEQVDDEAYVARGNGFCDSKFSPEFIDHQIDIIMHRINQLKSWIDGTEL